eukprot:1189376-Prorocentrum_minimum.AAC.4
MAPAAAPPHRFVTGWEGFVGEQGGGRGVAVSADLRWPELAHCSGRRAAADAATRGRSLIPAPLWAQERAVASPARTLRALGCTTRAPGRFSRQRPRDMRER